MGQTKTEELRWLRTDGSEVGLPKSPTLVADGQEEGSLCPGRRANPRQPGEAPNPPLCRCCPGSAVEKPLVEGASVLLLCENGEVKGNVKE